ncbi:phytase [Alteromonas sp. BL110]|uniref:phytase n=1 Tax=Alteromonas sp. BL110 TaxID=1714845 RepID=UPI000E546E4D|nr:phytase [Alteromonas sp. BL110]AXT40669.1 phytase [Alteromonas sp. BL110]RKM79905.1 phytase [Alteromonas sp. BL110]
MTKQRHIQYSYRVKSKIATILSACLALFSCAAANTANIAADSNNWLTKNDDHELVLPLTKLESGFTLTLHYKAKNNEDTHASTQQLTYDDSHVNNSGKNPRPKIQKGTRAKGAYEDIHTSITNNIDTHVKTEKNTYIDTHVINIIVKELEGVSLSNSLGKEKFIAGNYNVVNAEVVLHQTKQWVSLVMFNNDTQYIEAYRITPETLDVNQQSKQLTKGSEAICAATLGDGELEIINIDATGTLHQYEVHNGSFLSLRDFAIGPGIKSCALNTDTETLYLADEYAGVWQLDTNIESELAKNLIFYNQDVAIEGVATLPSIRMQDGMGVTPMHSTPTQDNMGVSAWVTPTQGNMGVSALFLPSISKQDSVGVSAWVSPAVSGVWFQAPCLTQFVSLVYDVGDGNSAFKVNNADGKTTFVQPEFVHLSLNSEEQTISLIVDDDQSGNFFYTQLSSELSNALLNSQCDTGLANVTSRDTHTKATNTNESEYGIISVTPEIETEPVENYGDAADDPAIWVNSLIPEQSRVFGTDKKGALNSYDLSGKLIQSLPVGRVNNVDVGYRVSVETKDVQKSDTSTFDIAVASNRSNNSLSVFEIDKRGDMVHLGDISTTLSDIYGLCMFVSNGVAQVFANDTSGRFERYHLSINTAKTLNGRLTQSFSLPSQPEGCVVNTKTNTAYLGEEGAGIWALNVSSSNEEPRFIAKIVAPVESDVEGLGLFDVDAQPYLIASSQGNDSYAIYKIHREKPDALKFIGLIQITADKARQIDGASETDGLDVTNANLGERFTEGLWVVQDGRNVMPSQTQNFKLVSGTSLKNSIRKLAEDTDRFM